MRPHNLRFLTPVSGAWSDLPHHDDQGQPQALADLLTAPSTAPAADDYLREAPRTAITPTAPRFLSMPR